MREVIEGFNTRLTEVEQFIKFVRRMQRPGVAGKIGIQQGQEFLPMLKACVFLLLYNAIESCVRSAFSDVYFQIKTSNIPFQGTTQAVQKIWITQQLDAHISVANANRDTYLNAVALIANQISLSSGLDLNARELPISGSLNADLIRELCRKHGVSLKTSIWAKGGVELDTIKTKRNALAHGHISFVECGREYDLNDLERMHRQTKHFMKGLLTSLANYSQTTGYKVA